MPEGNQQQQLDKSMAAIDQLRMSGKLDKLWPTPLTAAAEQDGQTPPQAPKAAAAPNH
jgi:hypothetical protein